MSSGVTRRVSARRGSTSAPDPHGIHSDVNLNPSRSSSSKLTIVRVPPLAGVTPLNLNEPPSSPVLGQRRLHRRIAPTAAAPPERVSFAFSTFGGKERSSSPDQHHHHGHGHSYSGGGGGGGSPSSSPRLRPSSPHGHHTGSGFKPRLTPDQLVDLARQSTVPRPPAIADATGVPAPATFTPLPDDIYLPFIDRPSEVATLISSPPDVKLFGLLAQTFPKSPIATGSIISKADSSQVDSPQTLPRDPSQWNFQQLMYHLTHIDRDISPDFIWAIAARKCILSHSELLWERIKGALGIPPELDVDYDFLGDDQESPDTSDISDDEGRGARGHWSDWDAVMDSPIYAKSNRFSMGDSPSASIYSGKHHHHDQEAYFRAQMDDKLHGLKNSEGSAHPPRSAASVRGLEVKEEEDGEPTITAPTPHGGLRSPSSEQEGMVIGHFSPLGETGIGLSSPEYLSIEPLLAPPASSSSPGSSAGNPPPLSLPASLGMLSGSPGDNGLGDIAEGAEEEETDVGSTTEVASTIEGEGQSEGGHPEDDDPNLISPSQIQGLRISTSPLPSTQQQQAFGGSPSPPLAMLSPISPLPPYPNYPPPSPGLSLGAAAVAAASSAVPQPIPTSGSGSHYASSSRSHSRAGSFSSIGGSGHAFGPFQRSESTGSLSASWSAGASNNNNNPYPTSGNHTSSANSYSNNNINYYKRYSGGNYSSGYASSVIGSDIDPGEMSSSGYISDGAESFVSFGGGGSAGRVPGQGPLFPSNFARLRRSHLGGRGGAMDTGGNGNGDGSGTTTTTGAAASSRGRVRHGPASGRKPHIRLRDGVVGVTSGRTSVLASPPSSNATAK